MIDVVEMVIKQPGQVDRVVRLQDGATRLGRAEDNEIVLSDVGVSRRHAQVYVSRSEVTVEDLGSGNGTYYNGYRVQSQPVTDGDEIVIDPFVLQFRVRGGQQRSAAPRPATPAAPPPQSGGQTEARLEVVVGTGLAGSVHPITSRGLSIGRSEDRDIVIPDPAASRHHCQITPEGGEYTLRDMGSANGVFVNAVRVRECQLADGDLVRIGNTEMRFVRPGQAPRRSGTAPRARRTDAPAPAPSSKPRTGSPTMTHGGGTQERNPTRMVMIAVAGFIAIVGLLALMVTVAIVGYYLYNSQYQGRPTAFEPQAPRWRLELPPGLTSAPIPTLFNEGIEKMKERNHREALQDFYRIRDAEPQYPGVSKWAFAAGEAMVLDALQLDFQRLLEERQGLEAERTALLKRARSSRYSMNSRKKAQLALRRKFACDPVVIEVATKNSWFEASNECLELVEKARQASTLIGDKAYGEAAPILLTVLDQSKDPDLRKQALTNLKLANQALADDASETWTEAVLLEAGGQKGDAKERFRTLSTQYPTLPSSRAHLERY